MFWIENTGKHLHRGKVKSVEKVKTNLNFHTAIKHMSHNLSYLVPSTQNKNKNLTAYNEWKACCALINT